MIQKKTYMKWMKTILFIEDHTAKEVSTITNSNISAIFKHIKWFDKMGWLNVTKNGRKNKIQFTQKGREIQKSCYNILKQLKQLNTDAKYTKITFGGINYENIKNNQQTNI